MTFDELSDYITKRRKDLGITQVELSKISKLSQASISKIENKSQEPSFTSVLNLLKALKITVKINRDIK